MADSGREVLRSFGIDALIEIIETTAYGVCVTGEDHRWVYLNPAGADIMGRPFEELQGRDYLLHFPEHERDVLLQLESDQRQGDTEFYTNTVVQPDGSERLMTWSGTVVEVDGVELAPAIFHETTPVHSARRAAADLAGRERAGALAALVAEAVHGGPASSAVLLLENAAGELRVAAQHGAGSGLETQVRSDHVVLSDLPGTDDLARGRSVFLSDGAQRFASGRTSGWVAHLAPGEWSGVVLYGVRCEGRTAGCLVVSLPPAVTSPSEALVAFWGSLADQIGVVLGAERIRETVSQHSAVTERNRIARDLHDSVSQALFSLHARAQVIRRALDADDRSLALEAAADLELLSRQATSELRELLGELRPSTTEGFDLGAVLQDLADDVSRLEGIPVEVSLSPATLPLVPSWLGQHVPRIVREALHNTVKHAGATSASMSVSVDPDHVWVTVSDDGVGFDPATTSGGFGQQTMRERAQLCGGTLDVTSSPGEGTTVTLEVPLH